MTQHTVVTAIVISRARCVVTGYPLRARVSSTTDTTNELTIATTSHHALTRHQNQRTRYSSPVPAPTWRITSKASLAESSRYTRAEEHRKRPSVTPRPTAT